MQPENNQQPQAPANPPVDQAASAAQSTPAPLAAPTSAPLQQPAMSPATPTPQQPQAEDNLTKRGYVVPAAVADYKQIAFYRKRWFIFTSLCFFAPAALIVALTGDIFQLRKGKVEQFTKKYKTQIIIIAIIFIIIGIARSARQY